MAKPRQYFNRLMRRGTGVPESELTTPDFGEQRENREQGAVIAGDLEPQVRTIEKQEKLVAARTENAQRGLDDSMTNTQAGIDQMQASTPAVESTLAGYKSEAAQNNVSVLPQEHSLRNQGTTPEETGRLLDGAERFGANPAGESVQPASSVVAEPSAPAPMDTPVVEPVASSTPTAPESVTASLPDNNTPPTQASRDFRFDGSSSQADGFVQEGFVDRIKSKFRRDSSAELDQNNLLGLKETPATPGAGVDSAPASSGYVSTNAARNEALRNSEMTTLNLSDTAQQERITQQELGSLRPDGKKRFDMHAMGQNMKQMKDNILHNSSAGQKTKMAVGAAGVVDGARRIKNGLKKDENGKRHLGQAALGVGEFTAGVLMARNGYKGASR